MKKKPALTLLPIALLAGIGIAAIAQEKAPDAPAGNTPIRALMITGGCCHDYEQQKLILSAGISERANVEWEILHEGGESRDHKISIYGEENWTEGYDIIVHNECFGAVKDDAFVAALAKAHEDVPSIVLHCAMHSYRSAPKAADDWRAYLGVTSVRHGKKHPITMTVLEPEHPVMKGYPDGHITPQGELYFIEKVWDTATPLVEGSIPDQKHVCVWVNEYGDKKSRVFGTTIGHHNETMLEDSYLDLLTRGLLWATGNLEEDGTPAEGFAAKAAR